MDPLYLMVQFRHIGEVDALAIRERIGARWHLAGLVLEGRSPSANVDAELTAEAVKGLAAQQMCRLCKA
ncbi:hypothetical protein D9M71_684540 [compost metagenome]